jgi:hypothetical protein
MAFHRSKYFSLFILFSCFFLNSCALPTNAQKRLERLGPTINAVEMKVQGGLEIIETGQVFAAKVNQYGVGQTAQAAVLNLSDSGMVKTVQFVATSNGPDLLETVAHFTSDKIPLIQATAEAVATKNPDSSDIPIPSGRKEEFDLDGMATAFSTNSEIGEVIAFYEKEMPLNGWKRLDSISRVGSNRALIHFRKGERLAIVSININKESSKTFVQISVQDKK